MSRWWRSSRSRSSCHVAYVWRHTLDITYFSSPSTAWSSTSGGQPRQTGCARNTPSDCARKPCTLALSASGSTAAPAGRSSKWRMKLRRGASGGKGGEQATTDWSATARLGQHHANALAQQILTS